MLNLLVSVVHLTKPGNFPTTYFSDTSIAHITKVSILNPDSIPMKRSKAFFSAVIYRFHYVSITFERSFFFWMPAHFKEQLNSLTKTRRHIAIITGKKGRNTSFLFKGKNIEVYCSILAYSPCLATVNQPPNKKKKTEI